MRVFLTGGTGFIGQPLARELLALGWQVTALVRNPDGVQAKKLKQMGAELTGGDVTDRASMRSGMQGADVVVHNAGHYELGVDAAGKQRMQAINVQGTENVLSLALELGVGRTVHVSTVQAFGDSGPSARDETFERTAPCRTTYEQTKTDAHRIALEYQRRGLPLIIACPNGVIGPNDHSIWGYFLRLYMMKRMPPMGWQPETVYSLVEVNDLARGLALAAEKGRIGETYLFCGEPCSQRQHLAYWGQRPGGMKAFIWAPVSLARIMLGSLEPLERMAGLPAFFSRDTVEAGATNWHYSSQKAQRELGWTHQSAEQMWLSTMDEEIALLARRPKRDWRARLRPIEM